jgi:hypothetical protein
MPPDLYSQGYGGPSLLSRGGNRPGQRGRSPVDFNIYGALRGTRDTGLIAAEVDETGAIIPQDMYGVQAEFGAYGAKNWRRSSIGLDYRGDYRKYSKNSGFDGSNQGLSLDYTFQPSRRTTLFARQTGGTSNRAFGGFAAPAFAAQSTYGVPLNEVYDTRTYFAQTSGGVSYRRSARSTYTATGDVFFVKRVDPGLIGTQGSRIGGIYDYRLSRSDTIGINYEFIRFEFPRIYGDTAAHMLGLKYDKRINRNLTLTLTGGAFRVETTGTQTVQLSPEIAAILGRPTTIAAFHRIVTSPLLQLAATYTLERSILNASYETGITPGNGVYITSRLNSVRAGYSYSGIRRLSIGVSAGYSTYTSLGLEMGDFSNLQGGGGLNYRLTEYLNLSCQADIRKFTSAEVKGRNGSSISIGLSFSPSRFPLAIW